MQKDYSVVVFDLGNVLLPFDYRIAVKRFNEIEEGLGDRFYEKAKNGYDVHRAYESGKMSQEDFLNTMLGWAENKVDFETFCRFYSEIFTINDDVAALLPIIKQNFRLVLLSNTNQIHRDYGWGDSYFLKHFEKLFLSHEIGAAKPEPEIYKAVEDYTGEPPEKHIFIDDIEEYVEGAKKQGWDGIQFKGYEDLKHNLEKRGIL